MPTLDELGLTVDLRNDPWRYPGEPCPYAGLLIGEQFLRMWPMWCRRIGQARVELDPDPGEGGRRPLHFELLRANVATVDARTLVVAVGSNGNPDVMRRKFEIAHVSTVLPMALGRLQGIAVGHSGHVSESGYVAAAPYRQAGAETSVVVAWLDDAQLACLDRTEPNYERVLVEDGLELESGERPRNFHIYRSRWGVIAPPDDRPLRLSDQAELLDRLASSVVGWSAIVGAGDEPRMVIAALGERADRREAARERLDSTGWVGATGLEQERVGQSLSYGHGPSSWCDAAAAPEGSLVVAASPDGLERHGEPSIVVHPDEVTRVVGNHAEVRPALQAGRPGLVVRVDRNQTHAMGVVSVDQVVRNALGVEPQESVTLQPAQPAVSRLADAVISRPHFIACRVQVADLATVEQPVCLLSDLAMSILGVDGGDEVVLEGAPGDGGVVPSVRLRAHPLPEEARDRRETLSGGDFTARFPSTRDALGVHPDLPWVFLDSAARAALGLSGSKLAVVRIRASRRHQLTTEIRELLLLLVLAFVGLASIVDSAPLLLALLVGVSLVTLFVVRSRLRGRLEPDPR